MVNYKLFAAITLPSDISRDLVRRQKGVPGARWSDREKLHITLAFFGHDIEEEQAEMLDHALGQIRQPGFDLIIGGGGHFGRSEPHAIWAGVDESSELISLHQKCKRAARQAGLTLEARDYRPHVTMAYLKPGADLQRIVRFEKRMAEYRSRPFLVDRFALFSSWQRQAGPNQYTVEATYPLHA